LIRDMGGISAVIEAMNTYQADRQAQNWGCAALFMLAENATNKLIIVEKGDVQVTALAMFTFKQAAEVQRHGCATLYRLAESEENHNAQAGLRH
jgi:hypothetical protein